MNINRKTVLITGATSGIGAQLARDYLAEGWRVIACGRNLAKLESQFEALNCNELQFIVFDVTDAEEVRRQFQLLSELPNLWIFNAGSCEYINDGVIDPNLVRRVFDVNLHGVVNCLAGCQMRLRPTDHIAIVGSIAGNLALPRAEAYGASKAALNYIFETLCMDWRDKGLSLSMVYPGFVATPLTDKNDFPMPMKVTVEQASIAIRDGIKRRKTKIYFPKRFTFAIRMIAALPFKLRTVVVASLTRK
jgi:NAD(P)-dependent dehydrogenase (short-subunit alcohol dehydrogenase family)